jgi:hypothetical protein
MATKKLHIVCLDVPFPPDHGGMFDLFYKIVALHESGTKIILHCFEYGKGEQNELKKYCSEVYYYKRTTGLKGFSLFLPYIVSSRKSKQLVKNLVADSAPILFEGAHTTYIAYKNLFPGRTLLFRLHNIEQVYYYHLFKAENNFFRKLYCWRESKVLKKYEEKIFRNVSITLPVSKKDAIKIGRQLMPGKLFYLPVFLPFQEIKITKGIGNYCLYHGNLSIAENERVAFWLADEIDGNIMPIIVAGKDASTALVKFLKKKNITLIANPSDEELFRLIQNAHINLVFSFNHTGIKLKLLNALFNGRHCIANESAIPDSDFKNYCSIISTAQEMRQVISDLVNKPFTGQEIEDRKKFLLNHFNNEMNAEKLNALL